MVIKHLYLILFLGTLFSLRELNGADKQVTLAVNGKLSVSANNNTTDDHNAQQEEAFNLFSEKVLREKMVNLFVTKVTKNGILAATFGVVCLYLLNSEFDILTEPKCTIPILSLAGYSAHKHVYHLCNTPLIPTEKSRPLSGGLSPLEVACVGTLGIVSGLLYKDRVFFESPVKLCMTVALASLTSNFAGVHYRYFPLYTLTLLTASNPDKAFTLGKDAFSKAITYYKGKQLTEPS